ncbi:hypothetical protein ODR15_21395 [Escherichia coli]|nr:hypothetical protein [Escherichia coli]
MAGYNMMYSYKRVIFFIFLLILALTVTHVVKTPDVVALSSISGKNDHKTRIFLFRHGERCDRSDNLCLSDADGITLLGAEQAVNNGEMLMLVCQIMRFIRQTRHEPYRQQNISQAKR